MKKFTEKLIKYKVATFEDLVDCYLKMHTEKKFNTVFGSCDDIKSCSSFINALNRATNWVYTVYYDGELAGLVWFNRNEYKTCRINFVSFDCLKFIAYNAVKYTLKAFSKSLGKYFESFIGYIEVDNQTAIKVAKKVGFNKIGVINNFYCLNRDVCIMQYNFEDNNL